MTVYVFGHRNPDTDAICSAIAYADLLRRTTRPDAVAACCGPPNARTEFALEKAGVEQPRIMMDVRPEIEDVSCRDVVTACDEDVFFEVYQRMSQHKLRAIPILSRQGHLTGILSLPDLLELVFHVDDHDPIHSRQVHSSLEKICSAVGGQYQNQVEIDRRETMIVMVGAMSSGGFTERLHRYPAEQLLVVSGDRPTIQVPALEHSVRGLVVTGGYQLSPGLLRLAEANNVTVINSPHDTATTVLRIKSARSIDSAILRDFITVSNKQLVEEARPTIQRARQFMFPVLDDEGRLVGVLSKSDVNNPPKPQLILVDHNEFTQAVAGAENADILEVLDHHRLGGTLRSQQPIRFINEPVGSTCTLVARQFRAAGITPQPEIALCMASGIISDTLFLRSPTTTDVDRDALAWLSQIWSGNLEEFAQEFFEIGSALRTCSSGQVVLEDCKEFTEHGRRFSISQIEEIGFDLFWKRKDELQTALQELTTNRRLDFSALMITDIATNSSMLLMSREPDGWDEINYPRVDRHLYELAGIVSRKKQLLPLIARILDSAKPSTLIRS
ncbi:MAG: putative manganese-dependent inorganic diphosphatase [Planctomycetales bacterium]|nr:putative manganese-dependent inorganic diphosphatase [Planctomycetales bacterium]MCA9166425.1 putative manganese-dependent inorganic diphosphatase [Planctomycetales bacterium]